MKTIEVTDEDYKDLMDLIKEYKEQEHDCQAYPRMWTVECTHKVSCPEGCGETDWHISIDGEYTYASSIADDLNTDGYSDWVSEEDSEINEEFEEYMSRHGLSPMTIDSYEIAAFFDTLSNSYDRYVVPLTDEEKPELNATLFKSDAKTHIKINGHNLARNPHTYAFTPYRMPKMHRLIDILLKLDGSDDNEKKEWM